MPVLEPEAQPPFDFLGLGPDLTPVLVPHSTEVQRIDVIAKVHDDVLASRGPEHGRILAIAAPKQVVARAAEEHIVARPYVQDVVAGAAAKTVRTLAATQVIVSPLRRAAHPPRSLRGSCCPPNSR